MPSTPDYPDQALVLSRPISRRAALLGATAVGVASAAFGTAPAAAAGGSTIRLAERGTTKYRIFYGAEEGPVVKQGAEEIAGYLARITGATFPLTSATGNPPGDQRLIVVGRNNALTKRLSSIDFNALAVDGFAMRTSGQTVFITGAIPRGSLYGAYWFLDRLCGVRWFGAQFTVLPNRPDLSIPSASLNADQVPRFQYRLIGAKDAQDAAYRQHNMLNGMRDDDYWNAPRPAGIDTWSHYWPEERPTYFHDVVTDQSLWAGGQLAMMDPKTRDQAVQGLVNLIKGRIAKGEEPTAAFAQMDAPWDPDAASRAFADAHSGAWSAPVVDMMNEIASRVKGQIPEARLETEAYTWSFQPPTGLKVDDSVVMTVAPISADFGKSLMGPGNADVVEAVQGWCDIADNIVIWDYLTDFHAYIQPFPNWWAMCEGIKAFAQHSQIQGYFGEGPWNASGIELTDLRVWVLSRLTWDPTQDADALIREFLDGYFGAAADTMYTYLRTMVDAVTSTSTRLVINAPENAAYLNFGSLTTADRLMGQAADLLKGDEARLVNLAKVRLGIDFQILIRREELRQYARDHGIGWDPDTTARLTRFQTELTTSGMSQYAETGGTPDDLLDRVNNVVERVPATKPQAAAGLGDSDWFDIQDDKFTLYALYAQLRPDDLASDHGTARIQADNEDWSVMLPLSELPAEGSWKLYASVRVDPTNSTSGLAFSAGVYPPFGQVVQPGLSMVDDGQYHEIALPGTYQRDTDVTHWVYVAPVNNPAVNYVYVDRVFAIRA